MFKYIYKVLNFKNVIKYYFSVHNLSIMKLFKMKKCYNITYNDKIVKLSGVPRKNRKIFKNKQKM
jgi:hypothetical protein